MKLIIILFIVFLSGCAPKSYIILPDPYIEAQKRFHQEQQAEYARQQAEYARQQAEYSQYKLNKEKKEDAEKKTQELW